MENFLIYLSVSDYVQLLGIAATFFTSIVAIVISVKTLRQNSKMIEESNRPYVSLCTEVMNGFPVLVLKNYGVSSAIITGFESSIDLSKLGMNETHLPFSNLIGTHLAPKQAIVSTLKEGSLVHDFSVTVKYKYLNREYAEFIPVKVSALQHTFTMYKDPNEGEELKTISHTLQEIQANVIGMK